MRLTTTNAIEIAENLIENKGLEGAIQVAFDNVLLANAEHEYFELSVWREVKRELLLRFEAVRLAAASAELDGERLLVK